jgi:uncharacterized protein (DUF2267 family)
MALRALATLISNHHGANKTIMTVPPRYDGLFIPVKYFLSSYRAASDGQRGIEQLEEKLKSTYLTLSDWKITWIGTCAVLRTAIDLFKADAKSCIHARIREEIRAEWHAIKKDPIEHKIYWDFLHRERNNIMHEYQWSAYEVWMGTGGQIQQTGSLLDIRPDDANSVLLMNSGPYKGSNSLELLEESAEWVLARIESAIRRAGFDPEEKRSAGSFTLPSNDGPVTLLGSI